MSESTTARAPGSMGESILGRLDQLPTLAPVALQVWRLASSEQTGAAELSRVIQGDQALTTRLLALANSSAFAARSEIRSVQQAIVRLGMRMVRSLALTVKVFDCFAPRDNDRAQGLNRADFWRHAIGVGCAARRVTLERRIDCPDDAFVAGLLHDVGKVALDAVFPKAYARATALAERMRGDIADCERDVLGVDHMIVGRWLAERWRLPRFVGETAWLHHLAHEALPASVSASSLIAVVQLADTLVRERHIGASGNFAFYQSAAELSAQLGIPPVALDDIADRTAADVAEHARVLGLGSAPAPGRVVRALCSANDQLGRENSELERSNRRLAASQRYLRAADAFARSAGVRTDLTDLTAAFLDAARESLAANVVGAIGFDRQANPGEVTCVTFARRDKRRMDALPNGVSDWLDGRTEDRTPPLPVPPALRDFVIECCGRDAGSDPLLLPAVAEGQHQASLILSSADPVTGAEDSEELRGFLQCVGATMARAAAQRAVRRLADELADNNRRLQQLHSAVLRTRTIATIAEMAAGAAHELNSPLTVISGRAQMLLGQAEDSETRRALTTIHAQAHKCSQIVSELMEFARPNPPTPEPIDLWSFLDDLRNHWLNSTGRAPSTFILQGPSASGDSRVHADRAQLRAVLDELVANAAEATAAAGTIRIRWQPTSGRPRQALQARSVDEAWVEIIVADDGEGMSPAVLQRAFDPFFSHRGAGRGRGLGLARAYRAVESHGGRIWLESTQGEGTQAHVLLPSGEARTEAAAGRRDFGDR